MTLLILSRKPEIYSTRRLVEEIVRAGHRSVVIDPEDPDLQKQRPDRVIPRFGTWRFTESLTSLEWFERRRTPVLNSAQAYRDARNKWLSALHLQEAGLPTPPTRLAQKADLPRTFPYLLKPIEGAKGEGVILVRHAEDLLQLPTGDEWILQEFVHEAQGRDVRLFVTRNGVIAAMEREAAPGDFRSNLAQGGRAHPVEPTPTEKDLAVRALNVLHLDYAGVDLVRSSQGPLILEVNACPGLEGIESVSGVNVAGALVDLAVKKT